MAMMVYEHQSYSLKSFQAFYTHRKQGIMAFDGKQRGAFLSIHFCLQRRQFRPLDMLCYDIQLDSLTFIHIDCHYQMSPGDAASLQCASLKTCDIGVTIPYLVRIMSVIVFPVLAKSHVVPERERAANT